MKTTPFFYFSGKRAYILAFLKYGRGVASQTHSKLFKNIEVIVDSRLNIVAIRFTKSEREGMDIGLLENNWVLTVKGECIPWEEQENLIDYCSDLKENGKIPYCNYSGSGSGKIQEKIYKKMCREIDIFLLFIG